MEWFKFQEDKTTAAIQLILRAFNRKVDFHKLFKILYFADQKHLASYGRPITGDRYIAMKDGPVPSIVYSIMKFLRGEGDFFTPNNEHFRSYFSVQDGFNVSLLDKEINRDLLSESERRSLKSAFLECRDLDFSTLREKSHDDAWDRADNNNEMSGLTIAQAGGANEGIIEYIKLNIENDNLVF